MGKNEKCANCNKLGDSSRSSLPELSKITFCSSQCSSEFTKKIEGGVNINLHSDAGSGFCAYCGDPTGSDKRTGPSYDANLKGKEFCCDSHYWAYSSVKELDVRKAKYSYSGSGTSAKTGLSSGLSFTPDLRAGRAVVDAAGFGLVADAAGGAIKAGKWMAKQAEEAERRSREDSEQECQEHIASVNSFNLNNESNSKNKLNSMKEFLSVLESMISGSGYEDLDQQYERIIPAAIGKTAAGIAILRGLSDIDVKVIDKLQLRFQKCQVSAAKGKGKYIELMAVLNSVSFDGGEKLMQKNIRTLLSTWSKFSMYSKIGFISFYVLTFPERIRFMGSALNEIDYGLQILSNIPGKDEKIFEDLSKGYTDLQSGVDKIKGTFPYVDSVCIEGDEKTINTGINELLKMINASGLQSKKGASADILTELCEMAVDKIDAGIQNLQKINIDISILDKIKIKLQQAKAIILTFGNDTKYSRSLSNLETISFDGGPDLIKNQVNKLVSLCPKKFDFMDMIPSEKMDNEEKIHISDTLIPKLEEARNAVNKICSDADKQKLELKIDKAKQQASKFV